MVSYKTTLRLFGLLTFIILASLANAEKEKNIYLPEEMLLKFNGKPYVRIYQAIYKEQDKIREAIDKNEYPILTKTDKKKMIKKGVNKPQLFKDIYQDENGRIIIFPNSHLNAKLYFGIADYCNELKYMHTYTTPRENTNKKKVDVNPFIKSFIVPYEIVYDILKRVKAEKENNDDDNSNACDLKYANQFGFKRSDVDLLREYTLPNTLVTFMENTSPLKGQHLGLIKHINIIPDKNAI
uniref:Cnidarian restricted protein n=1 Tax=Clytia hemisphaerica TaxID=252671 RepID=A0A7M5V2T8_9CNID